MRHVYAAPTGWVASLTNGGWSKYDEATHKWTRSGLYVADPVEAAPAKTTTKGKKGAPVKKAPAARANTPQLAAFLVNDMTFSSDAWYAATAGGVLVSKDHGATWKSASKDPLLRKPAQSVEISSDGNQVWAIVEHNLIYSSDKGSNWDAKELTFASAGNLRLHHVDDSTLFITTNMGLYGSRDAGRTWNRQEVRELAFQSVAGNRNAMVVSLHKNGLLASFDGGKSWQHVDDPLTQGYFPIVRTRRDGSLVAVSATEGMLSLEPGAASAKSDGGSGLK
jgi:photosystem II stability/assembly factor-like uncharacterized protein